MEVSVILAEIDKEIERLQQARILLAGGSVKPSGRGRKKKVAIPVPAPKKKRRKLSAEGRKRISEAMTRRWSERRKLAAAAKKAPAEKPAAPKAK